MSSELSNTAELAKAITRSASLQTFITIRLLADRGCASDAYRAYAYFRWVDDSLDGTTRPRPERLAFVARQRRLIDRCYAGDPPECRVPEEALLIDLVRNNADPHSPLAAYIYNMLGVMQFDAERRGRLLSNVELQAYQRSLAVAVTEAMHYFIGRDQSSPQGTGRYLAVTAAHITHMLRDTYEDVQAGYFNVPAEFLRAHGMSPLDLGSPSFGRWVRMRVELARQHFGMARRNLAQVHSLRCRIAACAYIARFEWVLQRIEDDGYELRREYRSSRAPGSPLRMLAAVLSSALEVHPVRLASRATPQDKVSGLS